MIFDKCDDRLSAIRNISYNFLKCLYCMFHEKLKCSLAREFNTKMPYIMTK